MAELAVSIAIVDQDKVLLMQREDFEIWCLPGGVVEDGESLAQAALREAREETGLEVELTRLVGVYSAPRWRLSGLHVVVFAGRVVGGTLTPQPAEVIDLGYFTADALPEPLMIGQRQRILDALAGIGGGVASSLAAEWPLAPEMSRQELYALRDRSGLPRQQFYREQIQERVSDVQVGEVPPPERKERRGA
jgi:ADP-ribose pyrophosphatase YjhB (NUDIX family)